MKIKSMIIFLTIFSLVGAIFSCNVLAEGDISLSLIEGDTKISEAGTYSLKNIETNNSLTVKGDIEVTLTIENVDIEAANGAAITVEAGAVLKLILVGDNHLEGAPGNAGIAVSVAYVGETSELDEENAGRLIIDGVGNLEAQGGSATLDTGAGAGIGGNGFSLKAFDELSGDLGIVELNGGSVIAKGGDASDKYGAGAGIGGGGVIQERYGPPWTFSGKIVIDGATVEAHGGKGNGIIFNYSAAAIGNGGIGYDGYIDDNSGAELAIEIKSGTVIARTHGEYNELYGPSAAIGGSFASSNGPIMISGGTVYAYGGTDEVGGVYSAAAIGSGENAGCGPILITGDAQVYAYAQDGAAAIGGGRLGYGNITINGSPTVYAYGGNSAAAIGGGSNSKFGYDGPNNINISLDEGGKVFAYGGSNAHSIGFGNSSDESASYQVEVTNNNGEIYMFNKCDDYPVLYGISGDNTIEDVLVIDGASLLWSDKVNRGKAIYHYNGVDVFDGHFTWQDEGNGMISILDNEGTFLTVKYDSDEHDPNSHNFAIITASVEGAEEPDVPTSPDTPSIDTDHKGDHDDDRDDYCGQGLVWSDETQECVLLQQIVDTSTK